MERQTPIIYEEGLKPPEIKPDKLAFKFPMCTRVMDVRGRLFHYHFQDGKIRYVCIGSVYIDR